MTFNCSAGDIGLLFPRGREGGRQKSGSSFEGQGQRYKEAQRLGGPEKIQGSRGDRRPERMLRA
jgi:hypothetical protein